MTDTTGQPTATSDSDSTSGDVAPIVPHDQPEDPAVEISNSLAQPKWWMQRHYCIFAAVMLANCMFPGFWWWYYLKVIFSSLFGGASPAPEYVQTLLVMGGGAVLGQVFLLGIWAGFGGPRREVRLLMVLFAPFLAVVFCWVILFAGGELQVGSLSKSDLYRSLSLPLSCCSLLLMFHAFVLPLKWLMDWRVGFDFARHPKHQPRMQFGIQQMIVWTVFCALPLGLSRAITFLEPLNQQQDALGMFLLYQLCLVLLGLALAGPLAWVCLARQRVGIKIIAAIAWCLLGSWGFGCVLAIINGTSIFPRPYGFDPTITFLTVGMCAAVAGNLLFLRLFGLKRFCVHPPKANNHQPAELRSPA